MFMKKKLGVRDHMRYFQLKQSKMDQFVEERASENRFLRELSDHTKLSKDAKAKLVVEKVQIHAIKLLLNQINQIGVST